MTDRTIRSLGLDRLISLYRAIIALDESPFEREVAWECWRLVAKLQGNKARAEGYPPPPARAFPQESVPITTLFATKAG